MLKAVLGAVAAMAFVLMTAQKPGMAAQQERQTLDQTQVEQWLNAYKVAWETKDADKAAALFTADARYRDNPFEPAHEGRAGIHAYWSTVTADQSDIAYSSTVTAVSGAVAMAPWHAEFTQTWPQPAAGRQFDGHCGNRAIRPDARRRNPSSL